MRGNASPHRELASLHGDLASPHRDLDVHSARFERWMMKRSRASHLEKILQIPAEYSLKLR